MMLQQTQVKTVLPYFARWMERFPDVRTLANAPLESVLKAWEGLGYYSRARNLHRAARIVADDYAGHFPTTFEEIHELPGIGDYTAGAIASLAFNEPVPAVDGNVTRVLSRIYTIGAVGEELRRKVHRRATTLSKEASNASRETSPRACGDLNEALIELGATVCTARNPKCEICPVRQFCRAYARGKVERFPRMLPRAKQTAKQVTAVAAIGNGALLVRQRRGASVNSGFWELPNVERALTMGKPFCEIKHSITTSRITLEVQTLRGSRRGLLDRLRGAEHLLEGQECWINFAALSELPFTGAHRKVITLLEKSGLMK